MKKLESDIPLNSSEASALIKMYDAKLASIFSTPEHKFIYAIQLLLDNVSVSQALELSKVSIKKDNAKESRMVFSGGRPAYHFNKNCEKLKKAYINFFIPECLPEKSIEDFKSFFIKNLSLLEEKPDIFYVRLSARFRLKPTDIEKIEIKNSGRTDFVNLKTDPIAILQDIKSTIKLMLDFKERPENKKLIQDFGFGTYKAYKPDGSREKYIDMPGENPVKWWHEKKNILKTFIIQHLVVTRNPDIKFKKSILDNAGFVCCKSCYQITNTN